jgi:hypothetical protein
MNLCNIKAVFIAFPCILKSTLLLDRFDLIAIINSNEFLRSFLIKDNQKSQSQKKPF